MFSILSQTARGIVNSLIYVANFSNNFNIIVYSIKKAHKSYWCSSSIAYQEKEHIGYLEYSLLMIKIHYISTLQFFMRVEVTKE